MDLMLMGNHFYRTTPEFQISENSRLTLIGNQGVENSSEISDTILAKVAPGLDNLRRLGKIDYELNHGLPVVK